MMWLVQVFMIAMVGVSTLLFGKQFINGLASINLNGTSMDDMEGVASQRAKQGIGLATGVLAGGVGGLIADGGISDVAKGAAMGGVSGGRGARPGTAAMLGLAAGRFQGAKGREARAEKRAKKEHDYNMENDPAYADNYQIEQDYDNYQAQVSEDNAILAATPEDAQKWKEWQQRTNRLVPTPIDQETLKAFEEAGVNMRDHQDLVVDSLDAYKEAVMEFRRQAAENGLDPNQPFFDPARHENGSREATNSGTFGGGREVTPETVNSCKHCGGPIIWLASGDAYSCPNQNCPGKNRGGGGGGTGPGPGTPVTVPVTPVVDEAAAAAAAKAVMDRVLSPEFGSGRYGGGNSGGENSGGGDSTGAAVTAAIVGAAAAEVANATAGIQDATTGLKKENKRPPSRPTPNNPTTPAPGTNPNAPW